MPSAGLACDGKPQRLALSRSGLTLLKHRPVHFIRNFRYIGTKRWMDAHVQNKVRLRLDESQLRHVRNGWGNCCYDSTYYW